MSGSSMLNTFRGVLFAIRLTLADAVREAHTATGGVIQSDGQVLVMMLGLP